MKTSKEAKPLHFKVLGKVHNEQSVLRSVYFFGQLSTNTPIYLTAIFLDKQRGINLPKPSRHQSVVGDESSGTALLHTHMAVESEDFIYNASEHQEVGRGIGELPAIDLISGPNSITMDNHSFETNEDFIGNALDISIPSDTLRSASTLSIHDPSGDKSLQPVSDGTSTSSYGSSEQLPPLPQPGGRRSSLFKSASGKDVFISESARQKAAAFFNDDKQPEGRDSVAHVTPINKREMQMPPSNFHGTAVPIPFPALSPAAHTITPSPHQRTSSLFQKANGGIVTISDAAKRRADQFLGAGNVAADQDASYKGNMFESKVPPYPTWLPASLPFDISNVPSNAGQARKSSLFQKASGGDVLISDAARQRAEQFMTGENMNSLGAGTNGSLRSSSASSHVAPLPMMPPSLLSNPLFPTPHTCSVLPGAIVHQNNGSTITTTPFHPEHFCTATYSHSLTSSTESSSVRKSSLLQKASGGDVFITDSARQKIEQFMTNDLLPVHPTTVGPVSNSTSTSSSSQPPAPVPTTHKKSSLFLKASGGDVFISELARHNGEKFMSSSGGAADMSARDRALNNTDTRVHDDSGGGVNRTVAAVTPNTGQSLQTASGGAVLIREAARQRAEQFMKKESSASTPHSDTATNGSSMINNSNRNAVSAVTTVTPNSNQPRKSSLFQKASGGDVVISDVARQRAEKFMNQGNTLSTSTMLPPASHTVNPSMPKRPEGTGQQHMPYRPPQPHPVPLSAHQLHPKPPTSTPGSNKSVTFAVTPQYFPEYDHDLYQSTQDLMAMAAVHYSPLPSPMPQPRSSSLLVPSIPLHATIPHLPPLSVPTPCLSRASLLAEDFMLHVSMTSTMYLRYLRQFSSSNLMDFAVQLQDHAVDMHTVLQRICEVCRVTISGKSEDFARVQQQLLWVVWTYIGYERRYLSLYQYKLLTVDTLVAAVQYRYSLYNRLAIAYLPAHIQLPAPSSHSDDVLAQRRSAAQHFSQPGRMSSLQRCTDIRTWIAPMCLCMSISPVANNDCSTNTTSVTNGPGPGSVCSVWSIRATDGWWWVKVSVDGHILNLINKVSGLYT
ncbi:hypothetical protein EON65_21130 [archaeon]|nr:MAG: hypothetical protein EON65_21130 [archaeon]